MTTAVALRSAELLTLEPASVRGAVMFAALTRSAMRARLLINTTTAYHGGSDLLCVWGPGHPSRFEPMRAQVARGGHVLAFDLAYWNRDFKIRCSIDAAHPHAWVMRGEATSHRFERDAPRIANLYNPDGPVVIAGIGRKAKVQYGAEAVAEWEAAQVDACTARGRRVVYRRKAGIGEAPAGVPLTPDGPIEGVLAGAGLVITWHSNVAVDAIRLGIPVVCRDGAARAVSSEALPADGWPTPLPTHVRDRFLWNLAWFQWAPPEAAAFWEWIRQVLR